MTCDRLTHPFTSNTTRLYQSFLSLTRGLSPSIEVCFDELPHWSLYLAQTYRTSCTYSCSKKPSWNLGLFLNQYVKACPSVDVVRRSTAVHTSWSTTSVDRRALIWWSPLSQAIHVLQKVQHMGVASRLTIASFTGCLVYGSRSLPTEVSLRGCCDTFVFFHHRQRRETDGQWLMVSNARTQERLLADQKVQRNAPCWRRHKCEAHYFGCQVSAIRE